MLQLTDTHISSDPRETYDGTDTAQTLQDVVSRIVGLVVQPECLLLTGDLVDDPTAAAYERLLKILYPLRRPVFCLPGNHDDPAVMREVLPLRGLKMPTRIDAGQWCILLLDTFVPGTHSGRLSEVELERLDEGLRSSRDGHALVCLHHPPVSVGSPWMDGMMLENPGDFFRVVDNYSHIRAIIWGHIHQEFSGMRRGVALLGCPSTCVQFLPGADEYRIDASLPGFRELVLGDRGHLETRVVRVDTGGAGVTT